MQKTIRSAAVMAAVLSLSVIASFAQSSGETIYKAKCLSCHGATGLGDTTVGKALKVRAITDPVVKKSSEAEMIAATQNGTGKMQPFKDKLTADQIKASVDYFRTFIK